jgi:organic radical activating enzyme
MSLTNEEQFARFRMVRDDVLQKVSPSFCIAKWTQSTIYLFNGQTHSCHHPGTHHIPVESIKRNPSALHNTEHKQQRRLEMLEGSYPTECDYCWRIEKLGNEHLSDRVYKSASSWSLPRLPEVLQQRQAPDFRPSYVEIAFESTCNFKCAYCQPHISSRLWEEIEQHGPYLLQGDDYHSLEYLEKTGKKPIKHDEYNPYTEAFWEIWPSWYEQLHTFRITGGEPLLSKHTWRIFDYVLAHPNPSINIALNTNLSVPDKLIDKLVEYAPKLKASTKTFQVFTSLESVGQQAEYVRFGMDYPVFLANCHKLLGVIDRLDFMTTVNILSASTFPAFLDFITKLRLQYNPAPGTNRVGVMVNYMRFPEFLDIRLLPEYVKGRFAHSIQERITKYSFNDKQPTTEILYLEEVDQLRRLLDYVQSTPDRAEFQIKRLGEYVRELDRRRNTNFVQTFPELIGHLSYV